jgi:hypothetical protein
MRYMVMIEVDEAQVLEAAELDNVEEAIIQELGWASASGIIVEGVEPA